MMYSLLTLTLASAAALALPHPEPRADESSRPEYYTLAAYAPNNATLNGLKAQLSSDLWLFHSHVNDYCPLASGCPTGNQTAFAGPLYPGSLVPGGQNCYVTKAGEFQVTVQHSHEIPADAYAAPSGWHYDEFPADEKTNLEECPQANHQYRCKTPLGLYTFKVDGAEKGGLMACPKNDGTKDAAVIYAVTPFFNQTGCAELKGLSVHNYTGEYPPVYSYY